MKIALVVGHTSENPGAYGNSGIGEWQFNDELLHSMYLEGKLPSKHTYYILYRSADTKGYTAQMKKLHKQIDRLGCQLSIEFHFNSFSNPEVNGNEVLYCSEGGKQYAEIMDSCLDLLPNRDRGIKKVELRKYPLQDDRGAGFCCRGRSYAIIAEPFFGVQQSKYTRNGVYREFLETAYRKFFMLID